MGYSVGLDIGTGSVGWAVLDENGRLKRAKGKNLIGVRLFNTAETAAERRGFRATRRRLSRRRWRLRLLADLFADELTKIDEDFLARQKYSYVNAKDQLQQDHFYDGGHLFGSSKRDQQFYTKYPTIYHLRNTLMTDNQQHDLREVYLAIHHIVKYRGNFLNTQEKFNIEEPYNPELLQKAVREYAEVKDLSWQLNEIDHFKAIMLDKKLAKSEKIDQLLDLFNFDDKFDKAAIKAILAVLVGNQIDFLKIFPQEDIAKEAAKDWKMYFSDEEFEAESEVVLNQLDDDQVEFFNSLKQAYDGFALMNLLAGEQYFSHKMMLSYDQHKQDLKLFKTIAQGLSKKEQSAIYQAFLKTDNGKEIKDLLSKSGLPQGEQDDILVRLDNHQFLPKQRTKDNGLIPYQLHLAELELILKKQGQYYPFLLASFEKEGQPHNKIEELVRFRVPYYMGPLVTVKQTKGDSTNHWVERNEGYEHTQVTPWNYNQVFNRDRAAKAFIERLTGTDTYLIGEPTLPKNALAYQMFTVLNALNNIRVNNQKIDIATKQDIIDLLFKKYKTVTVKRLKDFYASFGKPDVKITGLADTTKFNSNLSSYIDLAKVFDAKFMESSQHQSLLEKIIEIQTVFEDKKIAARELKKLNRLSDEQIHKLQSTHYTGWGNLSDKLLNTKMITNQDGKMISIMDALRDTDQNFMQIIRNKNYGVEQWITSQNTEDSQFNLSEQIDKLTTSPANKRGIKQSFRILRDIKKAIGNEPERVYLEFARETQNSLQTTSRYNRLTDLYKTLKKDQDIQQIREELEEQDASKFSDDQLYLYFQQQGKDMYTGRPIDLNNLQSYDVDHIIPQAFTKDDSLDNRVLVNRPDNARKSDSAILAPEIQQQQQGFWLALYNACFISKKKYERLTRTRPYSEGEEQGFIARQLVETRQIIKNVAALIDSEFEHTKAVAIRAEITGDMRKLVNIEKHRNINSYHHAFDALLVASAGQYISRHFPKQDSTFVYDEFNRYAAEWLKAVRKNSKSDEVRRLSPFGFVVGTMRRDNQDWSEVNTDYLRHVMEFKNILTTRRLGKDKGPLYKETILPADPTGKTSLVATNNKRGDTKLYGGFTQTTSAYMTLVRAKDKNILVKIPVTVANMISNKKMTVSAYIKSLDIKKFEKVLIEKIALGQLVSDDGLFYLASSAYKHNAKQLWLPTKNADFIAGLSDKTTEDDLIKAFDMLTDNSVVQHFTYYKNDLSNLLQQRDAFLQVDNSIKLSILQDTLYELQDDAGYRDPIKKYLSKIDQSIKAWNPHKQQNGIILSDNAEIIYQSPTGIFEKRVKLADLI